MFDAGYGVVILIVAAFLALIPANIAKSKGRSFGLWWFYGWMLFLVALIHAVSLPYDQDALDRQAESAGERRKCPKCAEYIKPEAEVCRFCGYDLTAILQAEAAVAEQARRAERERVAAQERAERERLAAQERAEQERQAERKRTGPERRAKRLKVVVVAVAVVTLLAVVAGPRTLQYMAKAQAERFIAQTYPVDSNGVLTKYAGPGGAVAIPAAVGGVRITSIGDSAFADRTSLTSLSIPESVTSIGYATFRGCTGLAGLTIPKSVSYIAMSAFEGCSQLTVRVPKGATAGADAFKGCLKVEHY